jgi:hypothetical protein
MAGTITWKTKGKAKERPKRSAAPTGTKEGKELVPLLYKANWKTSGIIFFFLLYCYLWGNFDQSFYIN